MSTRLQGMVTDGWALGRPETVKSLQQAGLAAVRIPFHSARASAHDWLAGTPGAQKRTWQALRTCVAAGLTVDAEVVLTRPTLLHLEDTLSLLSRLDLHAIVLRPLEGDAPDFPALAARWGLARGPLERAVANARDAGTTVWLEGFPACTVGVLGDRRVQGRPLRSQPCGACPGAPSCQGVSHAYLTAFGWQDVPRPAHRTDVVTVAIRPDESTRTVRHRLVSATSTGAPTLRLLGLDNPAGPELLAEALALSFERVEACGLLHKVASWSARDRLRLRGLARLDGLWLGPDGPTHDAAIGVPGAWVKAWGLLTEVATQDVETPSWPDAFRFLRDQACWPSAVPDLPPCLRPLDWQAGLDPGPPSGPARENTACSHAKTCGSGESCPGLPADLDPLGIAPL